MAPLAKAELPSASDRPGRAAESVMHHTLEALQTLRVADVRTCGSARPMKALRIQKGLELP
jgi:hypothetical protein